MCKESNVALWQNPCKIIKEKNIKIKKKKSFDQVNLDNINASNNKVIINSMEAFNV